MITKDEVVTRLLEVCPSFAGPYQRTVAEYGDLLYVVAGEFAYHLLALDQHGDRSDFPAVGAFFERLHLQGDPCVRELATIGFLEGIQNVWSNNSVDPEKFTPYLGTESRRWWKSLKRFWNGEIPYVGQDL